MLSRSGKTLLDHLKKQRKECGEIFYTRIAQYCEKDKLKANMQSLKANPPKKIAGINLKKISDKDGVKFFLEDGSWMLMRISDTEPVGRIYVNSSSDAQANKILKAGSRLLFT